MLVIVVFILGLDVSVLEVLVFVDDAHDAANAKRLLSLGGKLKDDFGS
jgi:hypothetical protein